VSFEGAEWIWIGLLASFTWGIGLLALPLFRSSKYELQSFSVKLQRPSSGELVPANLVYDYNMTLGNFVARPAQALAGPPGV